ncbi:hypothetical protein B9Z55_007690 [Caenorhabditis nigoni]|uniref:BTB domain-containing protein n=1 Tax=Caenorhabditis nigoni TaxID=1611254 RepID=A0A2G5VAS4_9PELO|nr:hypothetical protein B9Z55_007690 [Caenorhabditis nigoni]
MTTDKEDNIGIRTESEVAGDTSTADLLIEIRKMCSELISKTEQVKKNQKDNLQDLEELDEISEKLQSIQSLISRRLESNEEAEKLSKDSKKEPIDKPPVPNNATFSVSSEKTFKLKYVFKNVHKFKENKNKCSEWDDHFNSNWYMSARRSNGHLGLFVVCHPIARKGKWSIQAKLEFKVVGPNQNAVIKTGEDCYEKIRGLGFTEFLEWEKIKEEYLVDGNLTVEAKVTIIETNRLGREKIRKFDESQKDVSDVILVVKDTKFYVSKMFLASQSSAFKTLMSGNFPKSEPSEVKLNGIDPDDFHYFLEVLYGEYAIDEANVEDIARLADMYDAPTAMRRCEEFLLYLSRKRLEKKLEMATRYHMEKLEEQCRRRMTPVAPKKNPLRTLMCL